MGLRKSLLLAASSIFLAGALGCTQHHAAAPPPPPPGPPPIVQLADHNGFETGRLDGERDALNRFPNEPRRTRAYAETPGYDRGMGPFPVYRDSFRNAYLRGYEHGYHREVR